MAERILDERATVQCQHGGTAQPSNPEPRVRVDGRAVVTQSTTYTVTGCSFTYGVVYSPCVTGSFTTAAQRVKAGGQEVLLEGSQATCVPNGTGLTIADTQSRVRAT